MDELCILKDRTNIFFDANKEKIMCFKTNEDLRNLNTE